MLYQLSYKAIPLKMRLAGMEGFEPPTPGFVDRCSNPLSYTPANLTLSQCPQ